MQIIQRMNLTEHTVAEGDDGIRLDRWFKRHHPGFPHSLLEKYLRKGLIKLDGKKAKTSDRVQIGQMLRCPPIEDRRKRRTPKHRASAGRFS